MKPRLWFWLTLCAISALPILLGQQEGLDTPSVKFPVWGQHRQLFIRVPLEQTGAPFRVKGTVTDSNDTKVREFDDRGVNLRIFSKDLPALPPGTYRLKMTITDKDSLAKELDRFPPLAVIQN
jgi:hypothetical protein